MFPGELFFHTLVYLLHFSILIFVVQLDVKASYMLHVLIRTPCDLYAARLHLLDAI